MIRFTAPQVYIKGRAKHGGGRTYTPAKTVKYEKLIKAICEDAMRRHGWAMFTEPVAMTITIKLVPPKSLSKKKRAAMLSGEAAITGLYDSDNVAKAVSDALNKSAFRDDRLVSRLLIEKVAATYEAVDVTVEDWREFRKRTSERAVQDQGD